MTVEQMPARMDDTVSARWRRRLAGVRPDERRHWRTRTAYYAAVDRLLADGVPRPAWFDVIEAVRPKGSRSTFYEVTGAHAKYSLIQDLLAQDGVDSMQLALYYRRTCAVDQLIDEAKVWTYWPYRECLSMRYRIEEPDADNTFPVGLIYGPSGCGKSSLVKAGLLPRLGDNVVAVYVPTASGVGTMT